MSGLREAFDEIVADVPVYGDLDLAIEQAAREQRRRTGAIAGLAAAAAVLVVVAALVGVSRDTNSAPPVSPTPTPNPTQSPTRERSQSPQTWADTAVPGTRRVKGWLVPDPLEDGRDAWFEVATEHLDPKGDLERLESFLYSWSILFSWPAEGSDFKADSAAASAYPTEGRLGLLLEPRDPEQLDEGCGYVLAEHDRHPAPLQSCTTKRFAGPDGARARLSTWERRCGAYEGGGPAPATCGDYAVAVAVERPDGLIGYVEAIGRGTPAFSPVSRDAMAAAAADPRLAIPQKAFAVPSDETVVSVVADHLPGYRDDPTIFPTESVGYGQAWGDLGRIRLGVTVLPAGGTPTCGRAFLIRCVERRVWGADDPTTVFVGAWDEEDWASCCPRNSRADSREFVYVGARHTVVARELLIVRADEGPISARLDTRLIDLVLDPRLQ